MGRYRLNIPAWQPNNALHLHIDGNMPGSTTLLGFVTLRVRMVANTNLCPTPSPIFAIISISIKHLSAHTLSHRQQTRYIASKADDQHNMRKRTCCVQYQPVEKTVQRKFDRYACSSTHTHKQPPTQTAPHRLRSGRFGRFPRRRRSLALMCSTNDEQVLSVYLATLGQRGQRRARAVLHIYIYLCSGCCCCCSNMHHACTLCKESVVQHLKES